MSKDLIALAAVPLTYSSLSGLRPSTPLAFAGLRGRGAGAPGLNGQPRVSRAGWRDAALSIVIVRPPPSLGAGFDRTIQ